MLLVDDDEIILRSCQRIMDRVEVLVATSAGAAQSVLSSACPNAVLTDYYLGNGTGYDVLQATKKLCPGAKRFLFSGDSSTIPPNHLLIADEIVTKGTPAFTALLSRLNALQP